MAGWASCYWKQLKNIAREAWLRQPAWLIYFPHIGTPPFKCWTRIHSGLQHVKTIATGRVLRLICETSNTYYLSLSLSCLQIYGYQLISICEFQWSSLQCAPFVKWTGSQKHKRHGFMRHRVANQDNKPDSPGCECSSADATNKIDLVSYRG